MVRIAKCKVHRRRAAARAERELEPLAYSIAEFACCTGSASTTISVWRASGRGHGS